MRLCRLALIGTGRNRGKLYFPMQWYTALGAPLPGALALPFVATTIANQFILETLHKAAQADAQHLTDIPELDQIQSTQPAFYVADKRLWAVKRFGEIILSQPSLDPTLFEQFQENQVFISIDRLFHKRRIRPLTGQSRYIYPPDI